MDRSLDRNMGRYGHGHWEGWTPPGCMYPTCVARRAAVRRVNRQVKGRAAYRSAQQFADEARRQRR